MELTLFQAQAWLAVPHLAEGPMEPPTAESRTRLQFRRAQKNARHVGQNKKLTFSFTPAHFQPYGSMEGAKKNLQVASR